jgi:hypothetical protein
MRLWGRASCGDPFNGKFFRGQLISCESVKELLKQAFILVYKVGFNQTDIEKMTSLDRSYLFEFLREDIEEQNDSTKRN